jgi:lipopolysaccharide/colanic/teichoic acid biosynthesis glycosyltransferase
MSHKHSITARSGARATWYLTIDPERRMIRGELYTWIKRALDLLICLICVPLLLPLFGLIALLIALDSGGPILFGQLRTGKGGRRFRMYKFRTMVADAEALQPACAELSHLAPPDFKILADPRVTAFGQLLRRTSLDELPQLINVLRGDMTLVGPRPTSFGTDAYQPWHTARLDVVPGITGLSQVSGRSTLTFDQRVKLDLDYIERRCLWLDLQILLRTLGQLFVATGAYYY